ncbi:MAG: DNA-binding response regulator [Calditrichaeota bacterium]|nr:MAG: DNA-binding response regulator [Calditrichota bacterium]MBL1205829.1 DNA-binding response regulator [Calditrichota bacterium]NOG45656.1 response regulator transcription factor [Calditrichota bacterium]
MKILIVEDEKDLAESISAYLKNNDYICDSALDFDNADLMINLYQYDCVIVDITLPDGSGLDIIKNLKKINSPAGIIIISAKNALDDKVNGLGIGADDYLAKPFHLAELNARVRSVIRRRQFEGSPVIEFNEIQIQPEERKVQVLEQTIDLTKKEFDLLVYMISNKKRVITKETIAEHLWGSQMDLVDSFEFIYSHVKNLRKKLINAGAQDYIQTVYGIGYRFEEK